MEARTTTICFLLLSKTSQPYFFFFDNNLFHRLHHHLLKKAAQGSQTCVLLFQNGEFFSLSMSQIFLKTSAEHGPNPRLIRPFPDSSLFSPQMVPPLLDAAAPAGMLLNPFTLPTTTQRTELLEQDPTKDWTDNHPTLGFVSPITAINYPLRTAEVALTCLTRKLCLSPVHCTAETVGFFSNPFFDSTPNPRNRVKPRLRAQHHTNTT